MSAVGAVYHCIYIQYVFKNIFKNNSYCLFSVWYIYIYIFMDHPIWHLEIWPLCAIIRTAWGTSLLQNQNSSSWLAQIGSIAKKKPGGLVFLKKQPGQLHKENNPRDSKRSSWTITWPSSWHLILHLWCCWRGCRSGWRCGSRSRWRCGSRCCCLPSLPWCEWIHGTLGDHLIKA